MFGFGNLPEITKNLIIINVIMLLAISIFPDFGDKLALYYISNENFRPWQLVTHMFVHGGMAHLFFNMFSLFMFGSLLENVLGSKRFFNFYLIAGIGGAILYLLTNMAELYLTTGQVMVTNESLQMMNLPYDAFVQSQLIINAPMVGASGAIYGVLIGCAYFFPNTQVMLIFPPIPMRLKVMIILLILMDLVMGYQRVGNVAHFAHLGGALFGFLVLKSWKRRGKL